MGRPRVLVALAAVGILAGGAWQYRQDRQAATTGDPGCTPDGGLACDGESILLCDGGEARVAGECPGGCTTAGGVARCLDAAGKLIAPEGTACDAGMAVCGTTPGSLLVCGDGRLASTGRCPGGCTDQGPDAGLLCLDEEGGLRFAEGFACPRFDPPAALACDIDGRSVLRCVDGLLAPHDVHCELCSQSRAGPVVCLGEHGDKVDLAAP